MALEPSCDAADKISDFEIKPENSGNAEIDAAPMTQKIIVSGIVLYKPPSSDPLAVPVLNRTAPTDINNNALYRMCAKACAAVPFNANSVPIPTPTTIKPNWLFNE